MPVYTKEHIAEKISTNNEWLWKAVLAIYNKQTASEQAVDATREDNGIGFNAVDAHILSSFAKQIIRWQSSQNRWPCPLTPRQLPVARKAMRKYAGQLAKIANGEL